MHLTSYYSLQEEDRLVEMPHGIHLSSCFSMWRLFAAASVGERHSSGHKKSQYAVPQAYVNLAAAIVATEGNCSFHTTLSD